MSTHAVFMLIKSATHWQLTRIRDLEGWLRIVLTSVFGPHVRFARGWDGRCARVRTGSDRAGWSPFLDAEVVWDGEDSRRPVAFAAGTPAVSTTACSRWSTPVHWGWWLPGTIHRGPSGRFPALVIRPVISATAVASSSASVIIHPQLNSTFRRGPGRV
jgi:hypothetical protein